MDFQAIYLLVLLFFFYFFVIIWRSYSFRKRTGINPWNLKNTDDAHGLMGSIFGLISLGLFLASLLHLCGMQWYKYLLPIWYLESGFLKMAGWILLHASLIWMIVAQSQMKDSWRIGIDSHNEGKLITKGLFSISRNPIFLGMLISCLGIFLIIPNALTFALGLLSYFSIQIQVRLEEAYLEKSKGDYYKAYCNKVPRWF